MDESGTSGDHSSYFAPGKFNVRHYVCTSKKREREYYTIEV